MAHNYTVSLSELINGQSKNIIVSKSEGLIFDFETNINITYDSSRAAYKVYVSPISGAVTQKINFNSVDSEAKNTEYVNLNTTSIIIYITVYSISEGSTLSQLQDPITLTFTNDVTRTITYDFNGLAIPPIVETYAFMSSAKINYNFTALSERSGYEFLGWSENASAVEPEITSENKIMFNNVYLYAIWKRIGPNCYIFDGTKFKKATEVKVFNGTNFKNAIEAKSFTK